MPALQEQWRALHVPQHQGVLQVRQGRLGCSSRGKEALRDEALQKRWGRKRQADGLFIGGHRVPREEGA